AAQDVGITGVGPGGGADEAGQTVTLTAVSSDPAVVPNPSINRKGAARALTDQPAANAHGVVTHTVNGQDDGGTAHGGVDTFVRTFTITVTAVNDAPGFDSVADQVANEDSGAHTVSLTGIGPGGGADEAGQAVTLTAVSSDPSIVPNPS